MSTAEHAQPSSDRTVAPPALHRRGRFSMLPWLARCESWLCRQPVRVRLMGVFSVWMLLAAPAIWSIWQAIALWDIYRICLVAIGLSWYQGWHHYPENFRSDRGLVLWPLILSVTLTVVSWQSAVHVTWASTCAMLALLCVRYAIAGETLTQSLRAGVAMAPFIIALPLGLLETLAHHLIELHTVALHAVMPLITQAPLFQEGHRLWLTEGHSVELVRECSGLASLLGVTLFGVSFAVYQRLGLGLMALMALLGAVTAIAVNSLRVVASAVLRLAEMGYWVSPTGHEIIGILLLIATLVLLKEAAARLVLTEKSAWPTTFSNRKD